MNIMDYVVLNYDSLPKSTFNGEECVIVREDARSDEGYGHHNYSGYGVTKDGGVYWCYSSGCSCDGSCGMDHVETEKVLPVDGVMIADINHESVDFANLAVSYDNY